MWLYNDSEFTSDMVGDHYGFVYLITFLPTGQKYIGKKFFWAKRTLPPLKGKKRKRHVKKPSDWESYWSSSLIIKDMIAEHGIEKFKREIISLHPNKQETNYAELRAQVLCQVLDSFILDSSIANGEPLREYLNENIGRRYFASKNHSQTRLEQHRDLVAKINSE